MNVARPERVLLNFSAPSTFAEFMSLVGPTPDELDSLNTFQYLAETVRYAILPFLDPELAWTVLECSGARARVFC